MRKLSPKQRDFAYYYAQMDPDKKNGTEAAIKAGYSKQTARSIASENLTKPNIQAAIAEHQKQFRKEAERNHNIITPTELMESYTRDILFDPIDLVDDEGHLRPINEIPKHARLSMAGMEVNEILKPSLDDDDVIIQRKTKYKFPTKNQPRDSMAKILGLVNGHGKEDVPEWIREFLRNLLGIEDQSDSSRVKKVEVQAGLRILINSVDGMTRGIPSQQEPKLIEADNG